MRKVVLLVALALVAGSLFAETDYKAQKRLDKIDEIWRISGQTPTFKDDINVTDDAAIGGDLAVAGASDLGGDVTLESDDYINNSTATAVVLGYPTRRTTGGETNVAQLILYSADTNVADDIVADIASVRAYNDAGTNVAYASIRTVLQDVSGGSEDADVVTYIKVDGANTAMETVSSAGVTTPGTLAGADLSASDDLDVADDARILGSGLVGEGLIVSGSVTSAGAVLSGASAAITMADEEIPGFVIPATSLAAYSLLELAITNVAAGDWTNVTFEAPGVANVGRRVTVYTEATNLVTLIDSATLDSPNGDITFDAAYESATVIGNTAAKWLLIGVNQP